LPPTVAACPVGIAQACCANRILLLKVCILTIPAASDLSASPSAARLTRHNRQGGALRAPWSRWVPWMAGGGFFLLYAATAAPSIVELFDDTLEFQLVLPTFGIAHPTGYPLYTILGGLWSRLLPLGDWAGRANLFSALCAAVAVGLVCALAQRFAETVWPTRAGDAGAGGTALWAGVVAALVFGLGPTWWAMATVAEVYALHGLFVALILLLSLHAGLAPDPRRPRLVTWLALVAGLGLAHHRTTLLLLPGVALYLLWSDPGQFIDSSRRRLRQRRAWAAWVLALVAPLTLYLWLPLRHAMGIRDLNAAYEPTLAGFLDHVLARRYAAFFADTALAVQRSPADWLDLAVREMGWVALLLAMFGLVAGIAGRVRGAAALDGFQPQALYKYHPQALYKYQPQTLYKYQPQTLYKYQPQALRAWVLLLVSLAANLLFSLFYRVGDVEVFLLPVWLCVAVAAGAGVAFLVAQAQWPLARLPGGAAIVGVLAALLLVAGWDGRGPAPQRRNEWAAHDYALALTAGDLPSGSRIIGLEGEVTAVRYMQQALGRTPDAVGVVADGEGKRLDRLQEAMAAGLPTFLTRELPGIEASYSYSAEGALVRVWPRGEAAPPPPAHALDLAFAEGALRLVGYDLEPLAGADARVIRLGLHWLPERTLTQRFKLSVRVMDGAGAVLPLPDGSPAQADLYPLRLVAPTTTWLPGERIRDEVQILLPANHDGAQVLVILYDEATVAEAGRVQLPLP